jgi:hypothetical protein
MRLPGCQAAASKPRNPRNPRTSVSAPTAIQPLVPTVTEPARRTRILPAVALAVLIGLLAGVAAVTVFLHAAKTGVWDHLASLVSARTTRIDTSQPTVVTEIRRLARLESVSYSMDKVVSGDREGRLLPAFLTGDRILLEVHGEAVAGVDLTQLTPSDVRISGRAIHVHLPPAQIFTVALDDAKTHVYQRQTGLFVPVDPSLEGEVREQAVESLRQSALAAGVLANAHQNACFTVTKLLLGLNFGPVTCD